MIRAGVTGYPLGHTLSPLIHNHWIAAHGIAGEYRAIPVQPENFPDRVSQLAAEGYAGFNVTLPYKQDIMALCSGIDETARAIGAVNTVVIREGRLYGSNTDVFGFSENVRRSGVAVDFSCGHALVLGAGGAARAVIHALRDLGAREIVISNRTAENAQRLAHDFGIKSAPWERRGAAAGGAAFVVNTTSLGMAGQPPLDFDMIDLPPQAAVCDIVYRPLMTPLLAAAQARGNPVITGIGMLLHQARPAFREWFGVMPEVDAALEKKALEGAQGS